MGKPPKPWTPERVIRARLARGHTVTDAAALVGVARRTWQRWERGQYRADWRAMRDYEATPVQADGLPK